MQCPRCHAENREGRRFCAECGGSQPLACPSCGFSNEGGEKFCGGCGTLLTSSRATTESKFVSPESYTPKHLAEKILTSKSALEGERKQVTVLFADLKGSMELLADRDPEEARKILDPVLERMMAAVHHYEGTVNQVMGDGIMALFGAPVAHEDHAVRGCYAALRMQEAVTRYGDEIQRTQGIPLQIRVGLNSGEVVVRSIGSDLHMDYTAVGRTTHLAGRMEQMAKPGSVLVTGETLKLAEGYVQVKPLGPVPVKGLDAPVEVYEVTGAGVARTRVQASATRGLTRFVGRDDEIEHLRRVLGQAAAGRGQVVAIVGEAGVGKSRLVYEFTHSHRVQDWLILEAASVSYGKATSYLPVTELLKGYFKIGDPDDHRAMHDKVLGRVLGLDRALEPLLPPLLTLLDVPVDDPAWQHLDPPQRRLHTLDAVKRLLLRESRVQPLLVVFEDLHWIDSETQALLDSLVESLGSARLVLLVNYRPEYEHRWGSKTAYSQLRLDSLAAESATELLGALLGPDPGLAPLTQMLVKRGNPFFLEETVRTLVETGALVGERGAYRLTRPVEALQVPATVQTILAARIDRLPPEEKHLLQAASVIGKDVPYAILAAIAEQPEEAVRRGLAHLQEAEFLYETRLFPDLEHTFKHALTHEVTYGNLLGDRRRQIHTQIVGAMERLYGDRLGEHVERLGEHALRGEAWEKAVLYLHQAGVKASDRSANRQAILCFEQALAALTHLPETRETIEQAIDLRVDLRNSFMPLNEVERMLESLREAEVLADKLDDPRRRSALSSLLAYALFARGDFEGALESARRALVIARPLKDLSLEVTANNYLGYPYWGLGDYRAAITVFQRNVVALQGDLLRERFGLAAPPSVLSRVWLVLCLSELGEFDEGIARADEGIRIAEMVDQGWALAMASWGVGYLHCRKGELDKAIAALERFVGECRHRDLPMLSPIAASLLGYAYVLSGRLSEALPLLEEAMEQTASKGIVMLYMNWLGEGYLLAGRADEATRLARRALELARELKGRGYEAHASWLCGEIASRRDPPDVEQANASYHQALTLAEDLGMRPLVAHCHLGLGKLHRRTAQSAQAQEHLNTATTMYREMDMRFWLEKAHAEITVSG